MVFPVNGVAHMVRRALNTLDHRLMDHGERVAYLVMNMLRDENAYSEDEMKEFFHISLFHDIGAYKTEIIDSLLDAEKLFTFEIKNSLNHSIYGYLFLKNFSFLEHHADAILFHHFSYPKLLETDCRNRFLAAKIFIADRIELMLLRKPTSSPEEILAALDNPVFCPESVEQLRRLEKEKGVLGNIMRGEHMKEIAEFFDSRDLTDAQNASLAEMLPYAIDFRSEYTVTHTAATVAITLALADLLHLPEEDRVRLYYGSLLHDIGKIAVSLMILEKPGPLTELEFDIMKDHVALGENILREHVRDDVFRIAIRHHEKMDGSGYPHNLKAAELTVNERIVAIADILSALLGRRSYKSAFPWEKARGILADMADTGKLCPKIVGKALANHDEILARVDASVKGISDRYADMKNEYEQLWDTYSCAL